MAWVAHALTSDPAGVYQANIFYPQRNALAFSEANLVAGAIGAPLWAATRNPYTTHNAAASISFVIALPVPTIWCATSPAAGAGRLWRPCSTRSHRSPSPARRTSSCSSPAAFRSACSPSIVSLTGRPSVVRVVLGVLLWLQALACAYYGIFAGLMIGFGTFVVAATRRRWRDRDYWIGIGLAAFVSVALTVPFFLPYLSVQQDAGFARTLDDARMYSADLGAWFASAAWAHRWWLPWIEPFNEVLFPGVMALLLGAPRGSSSRRGTRPRASWCSSTASPPSSPCGCRSAPMPGSTPRSSTRSPCSPSFALPAASASLSSCACRCSPRLRCGGGSRDGRDRWP